MNAAGPQPTWWLEITDGYLRSLARRGRRPNTARTYQVELRDFGTWLQRFNVRSSQALRRRHIEDWQDDFRTRSAPRSQMVAAAAVRGALRWGAGQEFGVTSSLWLCVSQPSSPRLRPRPIPPLDLERILARFEQPSTSLVDLRTRALFRLILSSGARISEALSLDRHSIVDASAMVIQKGGSEHNLVISEKALLALSDYLEARPDQAAPLFVSYSTRGWLGRLGRQEAQRSWDALCRELGIPRFKSHQIRHSCGTELHRRHVDPITIAKHLGHRGLGMVMGYVEVALDSRRAAVQALDA